MSHSISFQEFVPISSPLSLLPFVYKFPSQQLRLESLLRTEDDHSWFADKPAESAVGNLTGTINPFCEKEAAFSQALEKFICITKEGEEQRRVRFAAVVKRFVPLIVAKLPSLGIELIYSSEEVFQIHVSPKDNKKLGDDVTGVAPLRIEDAPEIAKYWKYAKNMPGAMQYIEYLINKLPSAGIRGEDGELLSWALTHIDCHIGIVYTKENFRKKGYAKRVMAFLSQEFAKSGRVPHVVISNDNSPSISLFSALGFIPDGVDICWIGAK